MRFHLFQASVVSATGLSATRWLMDEAIHCWGTPTLLEENCRLRSWPTGFSSLDSPLRLPRSCLEPWRRGFIYPPVTHWAWTDEGWLNKLGYVDFAGSGPIHLLGGVCSFCAALFLGPRLGRFGAGKEQIVGHSVPLTGIGGMLLIVGFLSFNGGSLGTITNPGDGATVARVMINTLLGASGGSMIILASTKTGLFGPSTWNFSLTLNAAITGMVSVCASVNKMEFWASFLTGVIAGVVFINIHYFMLWCKVDDPLDAVAVHFGGGFWGVISASLFSHGGIAYGANKQAAMFLAYEMVGACAIISWGWAASCVMFGTLKLLGKLRVSEEDEQKGLDIAMHNEPGYHPMGWKTFPPVSETSSALVSHNDGHNKKNNAYRLRQPDFINPGFSDTENGIHPLEVSVRM
ncbi:putative ammonium transporter 1 isoform X3 [Cryptotermes secundus]|uniref:putative ammonium transporter 1 isoform X3 n=2 Tax=Cryptotermes secundus TaxID=105785 RepID=UPI000CD7C636|nr:putative ammonium transporter 1 isoform X3 [Cryptotermes secundus]